MRTWTLKFAAYKKPDDIFDAVADGRKSVETRPINPESSKNYANMKPGDKLVFVSLDSGKKLTKEAEYVHIYKSVRAMTENEDPNKVFPGVATSEQLVEIFEELKKKWGKDYCFKLDNYGIVAIGIK